MGGIHVLPKIDDAAERRCLNVLEELSLAANMPVPSLYVMPAERGINAFAAGITPADAVVTVTRGTIDTLRRHELQGVIAHELSHILNGDMRLNIRLAALLKGITFTGDVGHFLLCSANRRAGASSRGQGFALLPLGVALLAVGWLGGLCAGFIKAAISRQKEYLADANAVQFTRDNDTIGDALKVIGGYVPGTLVHAARANEMSHIFFGQIEHRLWQLFATHPPLPNRIQRVDPDWDGNYIKRKPRYYPERAFATKSSPAGAGYVANVSSAVAVARHDDDRADDKGLGLSTTQLEQETADREDIPLVFVQHSHEPLGAQALVLSLLIDPDTRVRQAQIGVLETTGVQGLAVLVNTLYPGVRQLGAPRRLPLAACRLPLAACRCLACACRL